MHKKLPVVLLLSIFILTMFPITSAFASFGYDSFDWSGTPYLSQSINVDKFNNAMVNLPQGYSVAWVRYERLSDPVGTFRYHLFAFKGDKSQLLFEFVPSSIHKDGLVYITNHTGENLLQYSGTGVNSDGFFVETSNYFPREDRHQLDYGVRDGSLQYVFQQGYGGSGDVNMLNIISPHDGYVGHERIVSILFEYNILTTDGKPTSATIRVTGGKEGSGEVIMHEAYPTAGNNYVYGYARITREVLPGENVITISIVSGDNSASDTLNVNYLSGVVDEDGDGLDDRTGKPIELPRPDIPDGGPPVWDTSSGIMGFVEYIFNSIGWLFGSLIDMIKRLWSNIGDLGDVFTQYFKFLPFEVTSLIILGLTVSVLLRILGR